MSAVAFVGLGTMGSAIAARLVDAGHEVHVWNRSPEPVERLRALGAHALDSPTEAFRCSTVFSMLANDEAVETVFSERNVRPAPVDEPTVHLNLSTVSISTAARLAERHRAAGVHYVAAPVLGRPEVAAAGQLSVLVAGPAEGVARAESFLPLIGSRSWYLGAAAETANLVKIGVNFNLIHALQALAESVTLVESGSVDPAVFVEILTDAAFTGSAYTGYGPLIAERRYTPPGFTVGLGLKDLSLAESAAHENGVTLPTAPTLRSVFERALDEGLGEHDWAAIAEVTRALVRQPIRP